MQHASPARPAQVRAAPAALLPAKPASALILDYEHKVLDDLAAAGSGEQRAAEVGGPSVRVGAAAEGS